MALPDTLEGWQALADQLADERFGSAMRDEKKLAEAVRSLSEVYTRRRHELERATKKHALEARLRFYFLRDLMKVEAPLEELVFAGGLPRDRWRVLDLGAGLGTTTCGIARVAARHGVQVRSLAVDADSNALGIANGLFRRLGVDGKTHVADVREPGAKGPFDLIVYGLVLNELRPAERLEAVRHGSSLLAKDGAMLIVEPALKDVTRELHRLRADCLQEGLRVFAPCLHERACPMLEGERDWCHESRPFRFGDAGVRVARAAGLRFERITYAYLTLRKDGLRLADRVAGARIVSEALVTKGKREFFLCTNEGEHVRVGRLDRHRPKGPDAFARAGRGDILALAGAVPKAGGLRIEPATELTLQTPGLAGAIGPE